MTVFFSDVVGSTSLGESHDPETLRNVLGRYFDEARAVVERHGGTVEKFIGDAVVALFGVPIAREDDALRALRAANELRAGLERLNDTFERVGIRIDVRIGVSTGEVVVDETRVDGFRVSGDTMNVAARLEQSAAAGEILIGSLTRQLGGHAIGVEAVEPIQAKGKARPLEAYRLLRVFSGVDPYERDSSAPLVGRERELDVLRDALNAVREGNRCVACTVVGGPGVGKSRLVREFVAVSEQTNRVLVGRCPTYGEGVTFLPLAEALEPVLGEEPGVALRELLADLDRRDSSAEQVEAALGLRSGSLSSEEAFSALRAVFESLARREPLVLVVDDVQWAEPTLLDFLEYLTAFSSGAPILLLCLSRPELVDERPSWTAPRENARVVYVQPLGDEEALELVRHLLASRGLEHAELARVVDVADGNPLFLEQLLALNATAPADAALVIPPTINALLTARLDQLHEVERRVLEAASVEGRVFHRAHVEALLEAAEASEIAAALPALAQRQFVRPARGRRSGTEAFAFVHALVRDAAYAAMPKERRARLHVTLADVLESQEDALDEIVGLHFADAVRLRTELGHPDEETRALSDRAAGHLLTGGARALALGDDRAAAKLLERVVQLVGVEDDVGRVARFELGRALAGVGRLEAAGATFAVVKESARSAGDRALELRSDLTLANLQAQTDVTVTMAELSARTERARAELVGLGDDRGLALAWWLLHWTRFRAGRYAESADAAEQAIVHATRSGDRREELRALGAIAMAAKWGPAPVHEALRLCHEVVERADGARLVEAFADRVRGVMLAMSGEFEAGREACIVAVSIYEELGLPVSAIGVASEREQVERLAGDPDAAEGVLRDASERFREIGDVGYLSWIDPALARVLALGGKAEEAVAAARSSRAAMQPDHSYGQIAARIAEAIALSSTGLHVEAEGLAAEALQLADATDSTESRAEALSVLATIDAALGRHQIARARLTEAAKLHERKGNLVSAARVRKLITSREP